ncbi:hypothetical protein N9Z70_03645 [Mariniblastus sp.]|nr:hypothetical protein [Mariniblastus sp.]
MPLPQTPTKHVFGRASRVVKSSSGLETIEIRMAVLTANECDRINWQPFVICDYLQDENFWNPVAPKTPGLPSGNVVDPFSAKSKITSQQYSWDHFSSIAQELLRRSLESGSVGSRRETSFIAPDTKTTPATITISTVSKIDRPEKKSSSKKIGFASTSLNVVAVILLLLFSWLGITVFYQNIELSSKGKTITDLQSERDELSGKKESLENELDQEKKERTKSKKLDGLQYGLGDLFLRIHQDRSLISEKDKKSFKDKLQPEDDPLRSLDNAVKYWIELENRIVTDRKRSEEKKKSNRELEESVKKLKTSLESLKSLVDAIESKSKPIDEEELENQLETIKDLIKDIESSLEKPN